MDEQLMRKSLLALWIFLVSLCPAPAQMMQDIVNAKSTAAATYSGPGDVVSGATAWYGLRAYSSGQVGGATKSVNLRRASDNATCDFDINTSGNLGGTDAGCGTGTGVSLATFATQDATASCTISTTTATCTSGSSVPHAGSTITGVGVTQPCYATAAGSGTAPSFTVALGGTGSSPCGTVGGAETLTFTYGLFTTEIYDQTGNGGNMTQATAAKQPELFPNCVNSLPCMQFVLANSTLLSGTFGTAVSTGSFTFVANKYVANTAVGYVLSNFNTGNNAMGFSGTANNITVFAGGTPLNLSGVADLAWHAVQIVLTGSVTSTIAADGSSTTGNPGAATPAQTGWSIGGNHNATSFVGAYVAEAGAWGATQFTPTQITNECHNSRIYWGSSGSC